jgi:hypothetical protein
LLTQNYFIAFNQKRSFLPTLSLFLQIAKQSERGGGKEGERGREGGMKREREGGENIDFIFSEEKHKQ